MDYRELANRMERNRDLIKERAHDRLVEEIIKANKPPHTSWFTSLRIMLLSLGRRKAEPQPQVRFN